MINGPDIGLVDSPERRGAAVQGQLFRSIGGLDGEIEFVIALWYFIDNTALEIVILPVGIG